MNTGGWQWVGTVVPKHLQRHTAESTEIPLHMAVGISSGRLPQHMVPMWEEHHGCFMAYAKSRRWNLSRRQAGLRKNNRSTWRRRMRIILTFPQISALCSSVCVSHGNNRAARDSPCIPWTMGSHPSQDICTGQRERFFSLPLLWSWQVCGILLPVFGALQRRRDKAGGDIRRSVYFLLHISVFHLSNPTNRNLGNGSCSLGGAAWEKEQGDLERGGQMRRGSIFWAGTVVKYFSYLRAMHKGEGKNWGVSHRRTASERRVIGMGH